MCGSIFGFITMIKSILKGMLFVGFCKMQLPYSNITTSPKSPISFVGSYLLELLFFEGVTVLICTRWPQLMKLRAHAKSRGLQHSVKTIGFTSRKRVILLCQWGLFMCEMIPLSCFRFWTKPWAGNLQVKTVFFALFPWYMLLISEHNTLIPTPCRI